MEPQSEANEPRPPEAAEPQGQPAEPQPDPTGRAAERPCPNCAAPAQPDQQWCLECGAELPEPARRSNLRPAIGIATTLTVLVGAASAGGFTLLQDGRKPPPPTATTTIAQQIPPTVTTPPVDDVTIPPLDDATSRAGRGRGGDGLSGTGGDAGGFDAGTGSTDAGTGSSSTGTDTWSGGSDTSTDAGGDASADATDDAEDPYGSLEDDDSVTIPRSRRRATPPPPARPRYDYGDIAHLAPAIPYPAAAAAENDSDPGAVVDGRPGTAWSTPRFTPDQGTDPQQGVYVDLATAETLRRVIISSPTPGITVEVYGARSGPPPAITGSGWVHIGDATVQSRTTVPLASSETYRYVLVWITGLPPGGDHAAISELQVVGRRVE